MGVDRLLLDGDAVPVVVGLDDIRTEVVPEAHDVGLDGVGRIARHVRAIPRRPTQPLDPDGSRGRQQEAVAWGVDITEKASAALSLPVAFGVGVYGRYGSLGWITSYEDAETIEDARGKMMADAVLQSAIDDGSGNVQDDATNILLGRLT